MSNRLRALALPLAGLLLTLAPQSGSTQNSAGRGGACDRTCQIGFMDGFLAALIAHDASKAGLAPNVRYTENGQVLALNGETHRFVPIQPDKPLPVAVPHAERRAADFDITHVVEAAE